MSSHGFYDVPRVLIANARSFQAFAAILDWQRHLASISCRYRSDARRDELGHLKLLYGEFQKYEVMTTSVVGGQPKNTKIPVIKQQSTSNALS